MSVINQMLRDLDARQASAHERAGLPPRLRPLPPAPVARTRAGLWLLLGLVAGATGAALFYARTPTSPPPAHEVAPAAVSAHADAGAPLPPVVPKAEETPPLAMPVPMGTPSATAAAAPRPAAAPPPSEAARAPTSKAAAVTLQAEGSTEKPASSPRALAPMAAEARTEPGARADAGTKTEPSAAAQIEKQPRGGLARERAEAEYRKGLQAAAAGDAAAALPALRLALELDPGHAKARQALLSLLAGERRWDEVKQVAQAGLALDPSRTAWAVILARLQYEQGEPETALRTLETYASQAATDAEFIALQAFLLHKLQRPGEAAQRYQAALVLRPQEGRWWYGLGLALEASGKSEEARAAYGRARSAGNLPAEMAAMIEQKLRGGS